jgi:hypothetical protein
LHRKQQSGAIRVRFPHGREHIRNMTGRLSPSAESCGCISRTRRRAGRDGPNLARQRHEAEQRRRPKIDHCKS